MIHSGAPSILRHLASDPQDAVPRSTLWELTKNLAAGDDAAWRQFHREHGPRIFRQLLASTHGNYDLANEALQQTYLRVARNVRVCDSEAMFRSWLRILAKSALNDCLRRNFSFWNLLRRNAAEPGASFDAIDEDHLVSALDSSLRRIDPDDRALLQSKYFNGEDVRDIAVRLSITPKAAESRLTRARHELRRLLEKALRDHEREA